MNKITKLRGYVNKILPLVYDDSLSYYEVLAKCMHKLNEVVDLVNEFVGTDIEQVIREEVDKYFEEGGYIEQIETIVTEKTEKLVPELIDSAIDEALETVETTYLPQIRVAGRNTISGKNVLFLGDSWCVTSTTFGIATDIPSLIAFSLKPKHMYNCASGSMSYLNLSASTGLNYKQTLEAFDDCPKTDIDLIIIYGSINDYHYTYEAIKSAVIDTLAYCRTEFPNATVFCIPTFASACMQSAVDTQRLGGFFRPYRAVKDACMSSRVPCMTGHFWDFTGRESYWNQDGLHPTQNGANMIAEVIVSALQGFEFHPAPVCKRISPSVINDYVTEITSGYIDSVDNLQFEIDPSRKSIFVDGTLTLNTFSTGVRSITFWLKVPWIVDSGLWESDYNYKKITANATTWFPEPVGYTQNERQVLNGMYYHSDPYYDSHYLINIRSGYHDGAETVRIHFEIPLME